MFFHGFAVHLRKPVVDTLVPGFRVDETQPGRSCRVNRLDMCELTSRLFLASPHRFFGFLTLGNIVSDRQPAVLAAKLERLRGKAHQADFTRPCSHWKFKVANVMLL